MYRATRDPYAAHNFATLVAFVEAMAPSLHADGFALDVEMLVVARALGVKPVEVPLTMRYETAMSSVALVRSGWAMAADILRIGARQMAGVYTAQRVGARARTPPRADR